MSDLARLSAAMRALTRRVGESRTASTTALAAERRRLHEQLAFGTLGAPRLLSDRIGLAGPPSHRLRIARHHVGAAAAYPFSPSRGLDACVSPDPAVRESWRRLLAFEHAAGDTLRGEPSTILDVPDARVALVDGSLQVLAGDPDPAAAECLAIPRFMHVLPPRKQNNFGHWLVDCVPQAFALAQLAAATLLVAAPLKPSQAWALARAGVDPARTLPWDGAPIAARRLLIFESDGRTGGGRPLSALAGLRQHVAPPAAPGGRRLYVSRRDARKKRRWVGNQPAVEDVFRRYGFEILTMADCGLDDQVRLFREASIVAGISGAGLTDLLFSAPGTHAIVLMTDSFMRWYAAADGAKSAWHRGERAGEGQLAALGDSPRFYPHLAAAFGQVCHSFVSADAVPLDELERYLVAVLARVEAS